MNPMASEIVGSNRLDVDETGYERPPPKVCKLIDGLVIICPD
jgi:hypothetical protein